MPLGNDTGRLNSRQTYSRDSKVDRIFKYGIQTQDRCLSGFNRLSDGSAGGLSCDFGTDTISCGVQGTFTKGISVQLPANLNGKSGRRPSLSTATILLSPWATSVSKRLTDVAVGAIIAIVTFPVILVLSLGSARSFRAWPIFRQKRLGLAGEQFSFLKVRSLPKDVPADIDKYHLPDHSSSGWGRFIRAKHLDEFPQCWLLITGKMTLVGPRPEMPSLAATYDPEFVHDRLLVRPGITGPWQISPSAGRLIGESPRYDLFYLVAASPALDLWILWRTFLGIFGGQPRDLSEYPQRFVDKND